MDKWLPVFEDSEGEDHDEQTELIMERKKHFTLYTCMSTHTKQENFAKKSKFIFLQF